jgi:radical SAM protein with 4Fe4S-binding SPASM domain
MDCVFCNFHSENESGFYDNFSRGQELSTAECARFLDEFSGLGGKAVTFCGSGETTIHPGFIDICGTAERLGLKMGLITNGVSLRRPEIFDCVSSTQTWVRISLSAGSAETFSRATRSRPEYFEEILGNIRRLKERSVREEFRIGINYVVTLDNYAEILRALELVRAEGADYIRFEPEFYSALGHEMLVEKMGEIVSLLRQASSLADSRFQVSIPKLDRGPMDKTDKVEGAFSQCHYSNFVVSIGTDGNLYPCPQVHLNDKYRIGNVTRDGYKRVFFGENRKEWMGKNPTRMALCKTCFYRPQNELLQIVKNRAADLEEIRKEYRGSHAATLHKDFV